MMMLLTLSVLRCSGRSMILDLTFNKRGSEILGSRICGSADLKKGSFFSVTFLTLFKISNFGSKTSITDEG